MKKLTGIGSLIALIACGSASATMIQGTSLQTRLTSAGASVNVLTDQYHPDEIWAVGSSTISAALLLFELGDYAPRNSFGVYDIASPDNRLTIFSGPNGAGSTGALQLTDNSTHHFCAGLMWGLPSCMTFGSNLFGYFLDTPDGVFFSESSLNLDDVDHMVAYEGGAGRGSIYGNPWIAGEFVLAWEDLMGGGDRDYNDFAVIVESVISVSEPASLTLFAAGILGIGFFGTRRRRALA